MNWKHYICAVVGHRWAFYSQGTKGRLEMCQRCCAVTPHKSTVVVTLTRQESQDAIDALRKEVQEFGAGSVGGVPDSWEDRYLALADKLVRNDPK